MPYLGFSSVFNIPMEQTFLSVPGEILNKIKIPLKLPGPAHRAETAR